MEVLVTGGDTELGRAVAEGFHNEGHTITLLGARRDDLEVAAKEIEADETSVFIRLSCDEVVR